MLDPLKQRQYDDTRKYLLESTLPEDTKDNLAAMLDFSAAAANGSTQKIEDMAQAQFQSTLYHVKHAIRSPAQLEAVVRSHATTCKIMQPAAPQVPVGKVAIALSLAQSWPFCIFASVAVFSPNFPAIADAVTKFLK